jgi:hypothetical protein
VALAEGGLLRGVVANSDSIGAPDVVVEARDGRGAVVGSAVTGPEGRFEIAGLKGGFYSLVVEEQSHACRAWKPGAAPPCARNEVLLVCESLTVRGQVPRRPILFFIPIAAALGLYIGVKEREDLPNGS